jgi:hypothetical protein
MYNDLIRHGCIPNKSWLIDKIPKIEYLTKLNNYGLYINKSASYNQIIYNNHYHYELYAYSNNGIFVYKK